MAERPALPPGFTWDEPADQGRPALPSGFTWDDALKVAPRPTVAEARPVLPEGYTWDEPGRPTAPPRYMARGAEPSELGPEASEAQHMEEARERAALVARRGVRAPYKEGPISAALSAAGRGLGRAAADVLTLPQRAYEASEARVGGRQTPEEEVRGAGTIFEAATLGAPTSVGAGTGRQIAREFVRGSPAAQAELALGVNIPRGIEAGPTKAALSQALSRVPFVGAPLRRAGQEATEQLVAAGERAAAMPAGRAVVVDEGGDALRSAINSGFEAGQILPKGHSGSTAVRIASLGNEGAIDTYLNLARSGRAADRKAFGDIRAAVHFAPGGPKNWELVQSSMIGRLGQGVDGAFDPKIFTRAWNAMPAQSKAIAFESKELTKHLDTIAQVSDKYGQRLERISGRPAYGGYYGRTVLGGPYGRVVVGGGIMGTAAFHPVGFLSAFIPPRALASALARPSTAASVANWTRSYDRLLNHPSPGAVAAFSLATRNMGSTLGQDFDAREMLQKIRENLPEVKLEL